MHFQWFTLESEREDFKASGAGGDACERSPKDARIELANSAAGVGGGKLPRDHRLDVPRGLADRNSDNPTIRGSKSFWENPTGRAAMVWHGPCVERTAIRAPRGGQADH